MFHHSKGILHPSPTTNLNLPTIGCGVLIGLSTLFLYCYYGKLSTESYEKMADCIYEINWHELPVGLQKDIILMIQNAQRSLRYHGFGMIVLNMDSFCEVSHTALLFVLFLFTVLCFEFLQETYFYCINFSSLFKQSTPTS